MKKKNIASKLYNISKTIGKIASITRDIEVLTSGDSKKIAKRAKNKIANKLFYKVKNKLIKKL